MSTAVLHVCEPTDGGAAVVASAMAADQVGRGWRVGVAAPSTGFLLRRAAEAGAEPIEWVATGGPGAAVIGESRRLRRILTAFDPDVVHLHSSKAGLVGRGVIRGRRPTMFQPHGWSFRVATGYQRRLALQWERFAARWAVLVTVSEAECRRGRDAGIRGRYEVVRNGVDTQHFMYADDAARHAARERLRVEERPTAVAVGRMSTEKGHDLLLDSWSEVLRTVPDAQLALVGDGPLRLSLEGRGVPAVRFVGEVDDVEAWYAAADVTVLPSWSEAMPLTVLEALASGRSVVATDVDGAREAIGDGDDRGGEVVPVGDPIALATAVARRLRDPVLALDEGVRGRTRMEEMFSLEGWHARTAAVTSAVASGQAW